jgi:hypothetical protein
VIQPVDVVRNPRAFSHALCELLFARGTVPRGSPSARITVDPRTELVISILPTELVLNASGTKPTSGPRKVSRSFPRVLLVGVLAGLGGGSFFQRGPRHVLGDAVAAASRCTSRAS